MNGLGLNLCTGGNGRSLDQKLVAGGSDLAGEFRYVPHHSPQVLDHGMQAETQDSNFVVADDPYFAGQFAAGDFPGNTGHSLDQAPDVVGEEKTDRGGGEMRKYYPMRLQLLDMDGNGKYEVLAAKNHDVVGNRLSQFRHFTNTHFELLAWDGLGLSSQWQTRKTSGHVRDFAIGDFDNDGQPELVAAMIIKEGQTALTKPKTAIIAYDLNAQ